MKAILTEIKIDYNEKFTKEELKTLKKYIPEAKFKNLEDFKPWNFSSLNEDEKKIEISESEKKYNKYLLEESKEVKDCREFTCDIQLFMNDFPSKKFSVLGTREVVIEPTNIDAIAIHQKYIDDIMKKQEKRMSTMMNSFLKMSENIVDNLKVDTLNQKCDVHIGGGLLMTVNEVLLCEDYCTNELQAHLDKGWRILAVCIQPDGRRPDYILGRFNPDV